jgi:hypothetical protein
MAVLEKGCFSRIQSVDNILLLPPFKLDISCRPGIVLMFLRAPFRGEPLYLKDHGTVAAVRS